MIREQKKLSIIVPVYNAEQYMEKCLDRLLEQSYKNIEIIIVNDCSKGNCEEIANKYKEKDSRVKYIKHEVNKGLFQARLTGSSIATGEYIAVLDSDDYVSIDYYRTLMNNIQENNSDIAMGNMVLEYDSGERIVYNLFNAKHLNLTGEECLKAYFDQEGLSFDWHTIWNKIYNIEIWKKALKHYKKITTHLLMTEDFAFSTVLFYYAKKLTNVENDCIYYCKHETTSTSVNDLKFGKFNKNITDITTSFNFIENFLKEVNIYDKYKYKFEKWKSLYTKQQRTYVANSSMSKEEKEKAGKLIKEFCPDAEDIKNSEYIYSVTTKWDDRLEKMKLAICDKNIKCVSFDIFDTLISRPFFIPTDLFVLLNKYFREYTNTKSGMDFSKIRVSCEQLAREKYENDKCQEITLDQIYDTINKEYYIDKEVLEKLKEKEIEYEIRFCNRRNVGYELYSLALAMGKKLIFTSDMYLPKDVIQKILDKNGYVDNDKLYLSSEVKLTKARGALYKYVLDDLKLSEKELLHIGDNFQSDVESPKKLNINAWHLPKATGVALDKQEVNNFAKMFTQSMPFWRDNGTSMNFIGIRTMLAMAANKYFDNPFRTFNKYSDFNADPYIIGYYILGMYMFGVTKWLLDETQNRNYENLVFMARDGYLPMETYKIMKKFYKNIPQEEYLYVSRKSLIPITIMNKLDFYKLPECINVTNHSPKDILKYVKDCITVDGKNVEAILKEHNINADEKLETINNFNKFIKVVIDNFYDEEKHLKNLSILRNYFKEMYKNHSANFDIGYSGRPELFLSNLCEEPIDTFFLNINMDEALRHADMGKFKLKTFFGGKPSATGFAYEAMLSALDPSCVGYNISDNNVEPIFEKYDKTYQEEFIIGIMQNAAVEFVKDITDIFGQEIKELYYENYYISLPIMAYINSSKQIDKSIFDAIYFEDNIRLKEPVKMTTEWNKDLGYKNQRTMDELIYGLTTVNWNSNRYLDYNEPDLEHHSKPIRFIYYLLFDRITFKRRMKEIFKNHKGILAVGKRFYAVGRGAKNNIYKGVHKIKGGHKSEK